jgi:glutamyl/glutaminyl-tRNA synthetase
LHFCNKFRIWYPRTTYIPRLDCGGFTISKTLGKFKLEDFRKAGYDPQELLANLTRDCLTEPEWLVENIKPIPAIGKWAEEALHVSR